MSYSVICKQCGQAYSATAEYLGRTFACQKCGAALSVPPLAQPAKPIAIQPEKSDRATRLLGWIRKSVQAVVDPDREKRISLQSIAILSDLAKNGREFNLSESTARCLLRPGEMDTVLEMVYEKALARAWRDQQITQDEQRSLVWVAKMLQLSEKQVLRLNGKSAKAVFEDVFVQAVADGDVDDAEYARLESIAKTVGSSVTQLSRTFFRDEAEGLVRGIFSGIVADKQVVADEWERFLRTSARLGMPQSTVLQLVQPQAMEFVEHTLADARADGCLSDYEEQALMWMLSAFVLPSDFVIYVQVLIEELKVYTEIAAGRLPSIQSACGIETRAGELVHYIDDALFETTRFLKSGPQVSRLPGRVVVTDSRITFSSPAKSWNINLRNVVECNFGAGCIDLRTTSKGAGIYYFHTNPRLAHAIIRAAVGRANQTVVSSTVDGSRHIQRDVRQRVWQRCSGRCVDCQATQYLEFDHIIPVARGGSNGENNVQLLCRACNQKKSDHI